MYTLTYAQLTREFHVSRVVATLGLSLFVIGLGVGPMVLAPLSEVSRVIVHNRLCSNTQDVHGLAAGALRPRNCASRCHGSQQSPHSDHDEEKLVAASVCCSVEKKRFRESSSDWCSSMVGDRYMLCLSYFFSSG